MKESKYMQCVLCEGVDLADSVRLFNEAMLKYGKQNPTFERYGDNFLIYFKRYEYIPESISEAKELQGEDHRCVECEHCTRKMNRFGVPDKRTKKAYCEFKKQTTWITSRVCDEYYNEHPDDPEPDNKIIRINGRRKEA